MHVHYRPAEQALDRLTKVDFVAVVGPTAVGKSLLIREAQRQWDQLHLVRSCTSRAPRSGEQDGVDCHFEAKARMEERVKQGEYATVVLGAFGSDIYATAPEDYSTDGVAVMPVLAAAIPMFLRLPFRRFRCVFIVPPSYEEWMRRLEQHEFSPEKRAARLAEAAQSLQFALDNPKVMCIVNDDLARATNDFVELLQNDRAPANAPQVRAPVQDIIGRLKRASQTAPTPV